MSYYFADSNGYIADAASMGGWRAFVQWANGQESEELHGFLEDGKTEEPADLASALESMHADDPDVEDVLRGLADAADSAEDVLIVSDGTTDLDEDEEESGTQ